MHFDQFRVGVPDLRSPARYLLWHFRQLWSVVLLAVLAGVVWMLSVALIPAAIGRGIDHGLIAGDTRQLLTWSLVIAGLAAVSAASGAVRHRYAVTNFLRATLVVDRQTAWHAADAGAALPREVSSGEVVTVAASDAMKVGAAFDVLGRLAGSIVTYMVVGLILLSSSVTLGLVVLLGVPVLVACLAFVIKPLQRRQTEQREEAGTLIGLGADTVAGLRVLRGIGGEDEFLRRYVVQSERVRTAGARVALPQATLAASNVLLPGVFMVSVTAIALHEASAGRLQPGDVVAFFGYSAFLMTPIRTASEAANKVIQALVGARKALRVLQVAPDHGTSTLHTGRPAGAVAGGAHNGATGSTRAQGEAVALEDPATGVRVQRGLLTALVSADPAASAAVLDRVGRFGRFEGPPARLDGVPVDEVDLADLRRRVLVAENDAQLFTGTVRAELDPTGRRGEDELLAALRTASALDVLDALPDGLDSVVEERGRSFSGGQRQRLVLTRALLADPEVLALVEPTSAVDAHTEARIAERLAASRAGRTTVVTTVSPLLLDHCDDVVLLVDGRSVAQGTHHDLMTRADYRSVVARGEDA
ncbi:ABC transporter transmembrane domain-containing protein [Kytococcus sedentarius]|uniref:ABC transporter transmembrane domain-containing protein n=1 Tax=Kytococcus sedentarius TaxID=1276 RepID=UPI0035BC951C